MASIMACTRERWPLCVHERFWLTRTFMNVTFRGVMKLRRRTRESTAALLRARMADLGHSGPADLAAASGVNASLISRYLGTPPSKPPSLSIGQENALLLASALGIEVQHLLYERVDSPDEISGDPAP